MLPAVMGPAKEHRRRRSFALAAAAAALGVLVYLGALGSPFVYDDMATVVENPSLRDPGNLGAVLVHDRFRPLVNASYALDYAFWELRPFGYHLTSVALHAVCVALFFALAQTVFADRRRRLAAGRDRAAGPDPAVAGFAAAALFAVHPAMTEAVGYVSGRSEVLCGVFFLSSFLLLRAFLVRGGAVRLAAGLAGFVLAVAAKEIGAMLPFVLAVYDLLLLGGSRQDRRCRFRTFHLPLGALVVAGAAVRLAAFFGLESSSLPRSVWQHVLAEWEVVWRYVGLLFLPLSQSVAHAPREVATLADPRALAAGAALAVLAAAAVRLRRSSPLFALGTAWFLLLLAPSSTVIPLNELMAEHRLYLASCGFFLALVGAASRARVPRAVPAAGLALALIALAAATVARNRVWADPVALWSDAVAKAPHSWRARFGLGDALRARGDCDAAVAAYAEAIRLRPADLDSRMNLGICLAQTGRYGEARDAFAAALEIDPRFVKAHNNLGRLAVITGRLQLGERYFRQALELDPANVTARLNLIQLYRQEGRDPAEILRLCREVAERAPYAPGIAECLERYR